MTNEQGEVLVLNPRRRRRKMTALQRMYFGGGRRSRRVRNDPGPARRSGRRHRSRRVKVAHYLTNPKYYLKRSRRNPPLVGTVGSLVREAVTATVGIQANNLVGNTLASKLLKVAGVKRSLVKVATAVVAPVVVGMFFPRYAKAVCGAGGAAIALEVSKALNRTVYPKVGVVGNLLSASDIDIPAGYVAPAVEAARPFGGVGYNSDTRYNADARVGAYVRRVLAPARVALAGEGARQMAGMYGDGASVY